MTTERGPDESMESVNEEKKPGRPKGAKNKPRPKDPPIVQETPPQCPRCQSTNRTKKVSKTKHDREVTGGGDGRFYRCRWSHVTCLDCGQVYMVRTKLEQATPFA